MPMRVFSRWRHRYAADTDTEDDVYSHSRAQYVRQSFPLDVTQGSSPQCTANPPTTAQPSPARPSSFAPVQAFEMCSPNSLLVPIPNAITQKKGEKKASLIHELAHSPRPRQPVLGEGRGESSSCLHADRTDMYISSTCMRPWIMRVGDYDGVVRSDKAKKKKKTESRLRYPMWHIIGRGKKAALLVPTRRSCCISAPWKPRDEKNQPRGVRGGRVRRCDANSGALWLR